MPDKYYALSGMSFDEVSLVPSGDNKGAHVVLSKADPGDNKTGRTFGGATHHADGWANIPHPGQSDGSGSCALCDGPMDAKIHSVSKSKPGEKVPKTREEILKSLPDDDARSELSALWKDEDEASAKKIKDAEDEAKKVKDKPVEKDDPTDLVSMIAKTADPALRAVLVELKKNADAADEKVKSAEAIAKNERDTRINAEMISKANQLKNISGTPDEKAAVLRKLAELDPELLQKVEHMFKSANAQLDGAGLFAELGKSFGEGTVANEVELKTQAMMKSDPKLTHEQAYTEVMKSNPDLYDKVEKEARS